MFVVVWLLVGLLAIVHPCALVWALAVKFAWPDHLETWADRPASEETPS
jgi:hypothetical protein